MMEPLMRLMPVLRLLASILLLAGGGSFAAVAQSGYPQRSPYGYPGYPGYPQQPQQPQQQQPAYRDMRAYPPGYYPGKLVQPAPQQAQPAPQQGFSLRRLFGVPDDSQPVRKPVAKPRKPAPAPTTVARHEKKADPDTHVVVFGDTIAEFARQGLDDMFSDDEDTEVVSKIRGDASLVRADPADWPNFIKATLDGGQKVSVAVVMLGMNDRQSLKEGENSVDLLSDRWKDLYRQRVDAILQTFKERAIPVVWIGLPPVKSSKTSEDLLALNEIYRESVQRLGGAYVDVWPGFVDEDNRYISTGPDVDGEPAKLRAGDGVSFTKAGARKIAHFADTEIDKILEAQQPAAGSTSSGEAASGAGQPPSSIEAALPTPPSETAPVVLPVKPMIGPVLPLTRPDVTPGGTLVSAPPKLSGDQAYPVQRALRAGIVPSAKPGRADDFRWPPAP